MPLGPIASRSNDGRSFAPVALLAPGLMYSFSMVDYTTLVASLENRGFKVEHVMDVPSNAGTAELTIDGKVVTLEEARQLLEDAQSK